jgi:hypothetical protein
VCDSSRKLPLRCVNSCDPPSARLYSGPIDRISQLCTCRHFLKRILIKYLISPQSTQSSSQGSRKRETAGLRWATFTPIVRTQYTHTHPFLVQFPQESGGGEYCQVFKVFPGLSMEDTINGICMTFVEIMIQIFVARHTLSQENPISPSPLHLLDANRRIQSYRANVRGVA